MVKLKFLATTPSSWVASSIIDGDSGMDDGDPSCSSLWRTVSQSNGGCSDSVEFSAEQYPDDAAEGAREAQPPKPRSRELGRLAWLASDEIGDQTLSTNGFIVNFYKRQSYQC
jgi:hypothetical protein